jgi:DNA-binding IclR family transcriptional regulator
LPDWFTEESPAEAALQDHEVEFEAEKAKLMAELEEYRERGAAISDTRMNVGSSIGSWPERCILS